MDQAKLEDNFLFEQDYWWFLGRRRIVGNLIRKEFKDTKRRFTLDAGCGTGIILEDLSGYAIAIGVDKSEIALKYTKKRGFNRIASGDICNLPFKNESFDLVTILGVLYNEGVRDDDRAVAEAYRVLKEDGIMIIDEAAYNFLQSKHNISVAGLRRYTRANLTRKIKKSGFKILKSSYWNVLSLPVFSLIVAAENLFATNRQFFKLTRLPKIINILLKKYLYLESFLIGYINFPFGPSIIIVAKKC